MILSAEYHGQYRQATAMAGERLIAEIMSTLAGGDPWVNGQPGETAELYWADTALTADTFAEPPFDWQPHSVLTVSINRTTGYGALRWNMKWATHNQTPPHDPKVIADSQVPYWFHPRHTLPLAQVDSAVREFCRREGARPAGVQWTAYARAATSYLTTDQYRVLATRAA